MLKDIEKLQIIKEIEEKGKTLKSPQFSDLQKEKLKRFEDYKQAYLNMKLQDPEFKIPKLEEVPKEKGKQFKLEEWILNHYDNNTNTNNNNTGDIKI